MTIAVTGANGQLGSELCRQLGDACEPLVYPEFDLTNAEQTKETLLSLRPSAVINTAAYTAVDKAEEEETLCRQINEESVAVLAEACQELDCPLVQVSTDYVYERSTQRTPFVESDAPEQPLGVYARTKLGGERRASQWSKHFVVRTCGLYSLAEEGPVRGRNFVDTMLALGAERERLSIVNDQHCTPTHVPDLARAICSLLSTDAYGVYHVTNSGETTWFEFAEEIFRLADLHVQLDPITTAEYGAPAPRPRYSVLNTNRFSQLVGGKLPRWQDALAEYMEAVAAVMSVR